MDEFNFDYAEFFQSCSEDARKEHITSFWLELVSRAMRSEIEAQPHER